MTSSSIIMRTEKIETFVHLKYLDFKMSINQIYVCKLKLLNQRKLNSFQTSQDIRNGTHQNAENIQYECKI